MTITGLIFLIILAGVGLWAVNTYVPMAAPIKKLLNVVVIVGLVLLVLWTFGVFDYLGGLNISPRHTHPYRHGC